MAKALTHEQAMQTYLKLNAKIWKLLEARRIAEKAFDVLKYGPERVGFDTTPEWKAMCKAAGFSEYCEFGDLTC